MKESKNQGGFLGSKARYEESLSETISSNFLGYNSNKGRRIITTTGNNEGKTVILCFLSWSHVYFVPKWVTIK